jgi:hypothetical protein
MAYAVPRPRFGFHILDLVRLGRRVVNAIAASRARQAAAHLRRHEALIAETARIHGRYARVRLAESDILPFND